MMRFAHVLLVAAALAGRALAQNLTDAQITAVIADLEAVAHQTWEIGTECEALTEYYAPSFAVYNASSIPPPAQYPASLTPVLAIAQEVVANRSVSNGNKTGPQPLIYVPGGAAGDPASIGVAVLVANWTGQGEQDGLDYAQAAQDQLDFLLEDVPRTSDGAISHRIEQVALWSDFIYMVPPFLAYYGASSGNQSLLTEAYTQIKLYRNYLYDGNVSLWKHIVFGNQSDPGHWSTGNAWAAAGMLRVLGTIQHSSFASALSSEQSDLTSWVSEIHKGMYAHQQASGLFANYADNASTFADASSTALLASTVYRLALLSGVHTYLPHAQRAREALFSAGSDGISSAASSSSSVSSFAVGNATGVASLPASTSTPAAAPSAAPSTSALAGMQHFTPNGYLTPVVDPYDWSGEAPAGTVSPEGEAFVVAMESAWRDWVLVGAPGANGGLTAKVHFNVLVCVAAASTLLGVL